MKYILSSIFAFASFAETSLTDFAELPNSTPSEIKYSFIPYFQMTYAILPGFGCSFRWQKESFGWQVDANSSIFINEAAVSALFYPWAKQREQWKYGGWNLVLLNKNFWGNFDVKAA